MLRLTQLAPDIMEATVEGTQVEGLAMPALMNGVAIECETQRIDLVASGSVVSQQRWSIPSRHISGA